MNPKEHLSLEITTALITAEPTLLKSTDPQLIDRRIKAALDLFGRVSEATKQRYEESSAPKANPSV